MCKKSYVLFMFCLTIILFGSDIAYSGNISEIQSDYKRAISFIRQENYAEALPYLKSALEKDPGNIYIKADYTVCLVWTGNKQEAVEFYQKQRKDLQKLPYVSKAVSRAFFDLGRYEDARQLYETLYSANHGDNEAFKGLLYCLLQTGNYADARHLINEAQIEKTISPNVINLLNADLLEKEQDYTNAYTGYLEYLQMESNEVLLKEAQDKRKAAFSFLSSDDINILQNQYRDKFPFNLILDMDSGHINHLPQIIQFDMETLSPGILLELAWSYFKAGNYDNALRIYNFIIAKWPDSCLAPIGFAYPLSMKNEFQAAHQLIENVLIKGCFTVDALFSKAFIYEKQRDFLAAIDVYEKILALRPKAVAAQKLRLMALSDLGSPSLAYDDAILSKIPEQAFIRTLEGNIAINRLRWNQPDKTVEILKKILEENPADTRVRYDYIAALRSKERMQDVMDQFKLIDNDISSVPSYVTQAMADACLYLEDPERALHYYKLTIEKGATSPFSALMGLFYTYQELREWKKAEQTWEEIKLYMEKEKQLDPWLRLEALQARGWYLAFQDKLKQAQAHFTSFVAQAGMNSGNRNALAYTYLWRGWPRRALEEFKIAQNVDNLTFDSSIQIGIATTLNQLNYKVEARELAKRLYQKFPRDKHVIDLVETFHAEDMNEFWIEGKFIQESPGAEEFYIRSSMTEPVTPTFKLFQEIIWQQTADDGLKYDWNRAGLGCEWIVFPEVIWRQAVTFDYEGAKDFGYYTTVNWLPTDHLDITGGFNSFLLDIPIRARATGIEGKNVSFDLRYKESDLRYYGFSLSQNRLSDGNRGSGITLYYDQNALNSPDFKIRVGGELNYSANSKQNVDYFSPQESYTFMLTQTFHYVHYSRYDKKVRSSIYTREGLFAQQGFKSYAIYGITYEQTIDISKTFAFLWNVGWDRKIYDGDSTHVFSGFLGLRKNF
ncbi:MAG: tetratricopeptide repeat protein [Proteobacteria bacterium]|nr:tetratricopeptide repeat protein [Pseudomonadota bacterium]